MKKLVLLGALALSVLSMQAFAGDGQPRPWCYSRRRGEGSHPCSIPGSTTDSRWIASSTLLSPGE